MKTYIIFGELIEPKEIRRVCITVRANSPKEALNKLNAQYPNHRWDDEQLFETVNLK